MTQNPAHPRLHLYAMDVNEHQDTFAHDVATGLTAPRKWLPPKYFYDDRGSQLYEQICDLPEYYPYRAEHEILSAHADDIHADIASLALVELGSGSSTKTRYLLSAYERAGRRFTYAPIDISSSILHDTAEKLLTEYPHIDIHAMHADFVARPDVIQALPMARKAIAFLGSSLGNLTHEESAAFLQRTAAIMGPDDLFLLGVDLQKSTDILIPAYDDAQGVTAAFNLNVLDRINRNLGGEFDLELFEHVALYNAEQGRIEMHLRSQCDQEIVIKKLEQVVSFRAGETIHTENSYKYTVDGVRDLGRQANLELDRTWFDTNRYFLLASFRPS